MSDKLDAKVAAEVEAMRADYKERPPQQIGDLMLSWVEAPFSQPYVAPPAKGFDTDGVWHNFNTASRSGYSTHAMSLHWMLEAAGVPTMLVPHRNLDIDIEKFPKDRYETLFRWHKGAVGRPRLMFVSFPPDVAAALGEMGPPLIPYCAFEGTEVSDFCATTCNKEALFRQIWVVSDFVRDAMVAGGVRPERVATVPPVLYGGPWSEDWFVLPEGPELRPVGEETPYLFGAVGTWHSRKGFPDLIRAYWQAFKRTDPVCLVLRTSQFGEDANLTIKKFSEKLTREVASIAREFGDHDFPASKAMARIQVITGTDATDEEIVRWLGSLDCYANAPYGAGLGIPHVWAKAQGVPLVSSGYGAVGQMLSAVQQAGGSEDEIYPHTLEPIESDMVRFNLMFDDDCRWGKYRVEDLSAALRRQFDRGRRFDAQGAAWARARFGEEATVATLRAALQALLNEEEQSLLKLT